MAVVISPIDINTETFLDWVTATNTVIDVISSNTVTTGGIPAVGNAIVTGSIQTDGLFTDVLSGGAIGAPGNLSIATNTNFSAIATFAANVAFTGSNTHLGSFGNITLLGSNTTHNIVGVNPTNSKLVMKSVPNFTVSSLPVTGSVLYWNGSAFVDNDAIKINVLTDDVTFANNIILTSRISANGSYGSAGSTLMSDGNKVYWSAVAQSWTANGFISTGTANSNFNSNLLFINPTTQKIGVKTATPNNTFEVVGTLNANTVYSNNSPVWTAANDGAGSGLDADLLDGLNSLDFIRRNVASDTTGVVTFNSGIITDTVNSTSSATNIVFNGSNFGFSQPAPIYKVDIAGTLRTTSNAFINGTGFLGVEGATNTPGRLEIIKQTGSALSGNIAVTTWGNGIFFHETGGTQRGGYLDIGSCNNNANSRIITDTDLNAMPRILAVVTFNAFTSPLTILYGKNVSSVSRSSTGFYTINFTTALPTSNYAVLITAKSPGGNRNGITGAIASGTSIKTTSLNIQLSGYGYPANSASAGATDSDYVSVIIVG